MDACYVCCFWTHILYVVHIHILPNLAKEHSEWALSVLELALFLFLFRNTCFEEAQLSVIYIQ